MYAIYDTTVQKSCKYVVQLFENPVIDTFIFTIFYSDQHITKFKWLVIDLFGYPCKLDLFYRTGTKMVKRI